MTSGVCTTAAVRPTTARRRTRSAPTPAPVLGSASLRFIGVDVAKATISVCTKDARGVVRTAVTLRNTEADITRWIARHSSCSQARLVMESTGSYHWIPALTFTAAGCDVRVVNPLLVQKYSKSSIRKIKNDPIDARRLCEAAEQETELPPRFAQSRNDLILRKKMNLLGTLERQLQELTATITETERVHQELGIAATETIVAIRATRETLRRQLQQLEREFTAAVVATAPEHHAPSMERLTSVPGVSPFCAALVLHAFRMDVPNGGRSWSAYIGTDVSVRESGTWHGRCRLSKRGNPYLRKRLFSAAWGAVMHDARFKSYYTSLKEEHGKAHVEALTIISRKLLRIMFVLQQRQCMFDTSLPILPKIA